MGLVPVCLVLIANAMMQEKGFEPLANRLLIEHGAFPGAGEIAYRLVIDVRHIDR
jgi:hypothetical protein